MRCVRCGYRIPEKKELVIKGNPDNPRTKGHYWLKCPRCKAANAIKANKARVILGIQMDLHQVRLNQLWA